MGGGVTDGNVISVGNVTPPAASSTMQAENLIFDMPLERFISQLSLWRHPFAYVSQKPEVYKLGAATYGCGNLLEARVDSPT